MDRMRICLTFILGIAVVCPPASADESADKFALGKLVPADSILYAHGVHNPEREFLEKHWSHVWEALKSSGIDADIKTLVKRHYHTDEEATDFDVKWNKAVELCKGVNWSDLGYHETVVFMKSLGEFAVLLKPKEDTLDANVKGLVAIMEELSTMEENRWW